jgi:4-hydroxybenzoyl-CoA thioesterase
MKSDLTFRVEWGESDPAEIVFYPNFFRWYDHGTWNLLIQAGLDLEALRTDFSLIGCPIVEARSKFLHPARFWDLAHLTSFVRAWNRKTFEVAHEVRIGDKLYTEALEIRVCARRAPERPGQIEAVVIPEAMKQRLPVVTA